MTMAYDILRRPIEKGDLVQYSSIIKGNPTIGVGKVMGISDTGSIKVRSFMHNHILDNLREIQNLEKNVRISEKSYEYTVISFPSISTSKLSSEEAQQYLLTIMSSL